MESTGPRWRSAQVPKVEQPASTCEAGCRSERKGDPMAEVRLTPTEQLMYDLEETILPQLEQFGPRLKRESAHEMVRIELYLIERISGRLNRLARS
jgi:hypothetical protein